MEELISKRRVVPETYVQLLYEYLESQNRSPECVLAKPWPKPDASGIRGIDEDIWSNMLDRAEEELDDPYLAINVAKTMAARHLGVMGAVFLACENLGAALKRLERYQRLIFDTVPMVTMSGQESVVLEWDTYENRTSRMVDEVGLAVIVQFCRGVTRVPISPLQVEFTHKGPQDIRPYEEFFCGPVRFQSKKLALHVRPELLQAPLKTSDPGLIRVLDQYVESLLPQLPPEEFLLTQLHQAIASLLREGEPSIHVVSQKMGRHSRTLQRQLKEEGTTFRDELQSVRHKLAELYLSDQRLQVVDVAMLLGFSEHSAFTRSFRKWSGKTPADFREERLGEPLNCP